MKYLNYFQEHLFLFLFQNTAPILNDTFTDNNHTEIVVIKDIKDTEDLTINLPAVDIQNSEPTKIYESINEEPIALSFPKQPASPFAYENPNAVIPDNSRLPLSLNRFPR